MSGHTKWFGRQVHLPRVLTLALQLTRTPIRSKSCRMPTVKEIITFKMAILSRSQFAARFQHLIRTQTSHSQWPLMQFRHARLLRRQSIIKTTLWMIRWCCLLRLTLYRPAHAAGLQSAILFHQRQAFLSTTLQGLARHLHGRRLTRLILGLIP